MTTYYILIEDWGVYVKEGEFFKNQGGLTMLWGKKWRPVEAESIADARSKGYTIRDGGETHAGPSRIG